MSRTEDRLREAFGDGAELVRREELRPLRVPKTRARRVRGPWLTPVVAAAAMGMAIVLSIMLAGGTARGPVTSEPGGMPAFIVAVTGFDHLPRGSGVEVRDSRTGQVYDTQYAPRGQVFQYVAAGPGGRTFYVMLVPSRQAACNTLVIYRMEITDRGRISRFARIGTQVQGGTYRPVSDNPGALAVSLDGRKIAYTVLECSYPRLRFKIGVIDTASGALREWKDPDETGIASLSWTAGGGLAFLRRKPVYATDGSGGIAYRDTTVRLLNSASANLDLRATKVLLREGPTLKPYWAATINAAGDVVTVVAQDPQDDGTMTVSEVSVTGGRILRTLHREGHWDNPLPDQSDIWGVALKSDSSGRHLLFMDRDPMPSRGGHIDDGVYHPFLDHDPTEGDGEDTLDTHDFAW